MTTPSSSENEAIARGDDFYVERGLYVFTAAYHRRRGYCCKSGCRHCPYKLAPTAPQGDRRPPEAPSADV